MSERVDAMMQGHEALAARGVSVSRADVSNAEASGPLTVGRRVERLAPPNDYDGVGRLRMVTPVTIGNRVVARL